MADDSLLNYIVSMQQQGYSDDQISQTLLQQGFSPADVNDAINKSKIKAAVNQPAAAPAAVAPGVQQAAPEAPVSETAPAAGAPAGGYYPEYVQGLSTETVTEITEQIINEKLGEVTSALSDVSVFKERVDKQISLLDERTKKVENVIDELKSSIIKRLGDYGQGIDDIKNEMGMIQDSFSKVVKPLSEKARTATLSVSKKEKIEEKPEEPEKETLSDRLRR